MTNMHCEHIEEMLAQQADGPLPLEATAHLDACPQCRLLRDDLQAIAVAAQEWGSDEPAPPPHVWAAIEARLQAEGLIALPSLPSAAATQQGWLSGFWNFSSRLELAGAYVLAMLIAAGIAGYSTAPVSDAFDRPATIEQVSRPALDGLGSTLDGNMQRVVASFPADRDYYDSVSFSLQQNLQIVDNFIAVCEKSVREHPGDPLAREYLYGAYQQKADLLAVATDRSELETK
jgi:hypothetical protein